jgi:hypothetical protein
VQFELVLDFDENSFNFSQVNEDEILFYLDLENEEVVKQQNEGFEHPLLINIAPICRFHSILTPFLNE